MKIGIRLRPLLTWSLGPFVGNVRLKKRWKR